MKKYILTDVKINVLGKTLFQIKATRSFGNVKKGDLGGYIEKEGNLSHDGNAWVYDDAWVCGGARVYDDARVYDNAWVYDDAWVYGNSSIMWITGIGPSIGTTTFFGNKDNNIYVSCRCFNGSIEEFEESIHKTHKGNTYKKEYMLAIELAKLKILGE